MKLRRILGGRWLFEGGSWRRRTDRLVDDSLRGHLGLAAPAGDLLAGEEPAHQRPILGSLMEARQLRRGHAPDDTARQAARDGERGADTDARVVSVALAVGVRFA